MTGCELFFTVIPSLCWRYWVSEGGSPAGDIREVTELMGAEKKEKESAPLELLILCVIRGLEQISSSRMAGKTATASRASSCEI